MKSLGQVESDISTAFNKLQKDLTGRGPEDTKTYIINDMVIVRQKGVLTPEEKQLARTESGKKLIKQLRQELWESHLDECTQIIQTATGCKIISSHNDISTKTGEKLEIFIMDKKIDLIRQD